MKNFIRIIFLAAVICAAAVSCDKYDDSEIRESIKDLQDRVTALEQSVAENVSALQSIVSLGSVGSCEFDMEAGKVVLSLVDGKSLEIDLDVKGYSLLTVVEGEDGEYYWALCDDGQTTPLLVNGKQVPVTVTPALEVSESGEWMISTDGGKNWVATGIYQQECECTPGDGGVNIPETPSVSFFENVEYDGDFLYLTLMDGKKIKVEVVGESIFSTAETAMYFARESVEKSIVIEMNNVKAFTITEKPEGWKARIDYNEEDEVYSLVVTSPAVISDAAKTGTVKVLGLFNGGGNPEILAVDVIYEDAFVLSSAVGPSVKVTVSEHALGDYDGYVLGAWKLEDYTPEAVIAWLNSEEGYLTECRTESKVYQMTELVEDYDFSLAFVVFAAPHIPVKQMVSGAESYAIEDLQIVEIGSTYAVGTFKDITYDSAFLSLTSYMTGYFGGFSELGFWEAYGKDNMLESLSQGNMSPMSIPTYEGYANAFPDGMEGAQILPGKDYVVWLMPESETGTYVAEDFIYFTFTSAPIVADASVAAPECEITAITYGGFTAKVTPAAGAYKTYAAIRNVLAVPEDIEQSVIELIDINKFSLGSSSFTVSSNSFSENDEVCILAVSVTEDGHYGQVLQQIVPLKTLEYTDDIGVEVSSKMHGFGDVTVTLDLTGNPSTVSYYCSSTNFFGDDVLQDMLAKGQLGDAVNDMEISKLAEGNTIELSGLTLGIEYTFYVLVKDASGVPSYMKSVKFIPIVLMDYLMSNHKDYKYGMPQVSGKKSGAKYTYTVTKPETCVKYWMFIGDFEYITGSPTVPTISDEYGATDKLVTMQLKDVGAMELEASHEGTYSPVRNTTRMYLSWLDDKGNYHIIYTLNPNK